MHGQEIQVFSWVWHPSAPNFETTALSKLTQMVMPLTCTGRWPVQILAGTPAIQIEIYHAFSQFFQENVKITQQITFFTGTHTIPTYNVQLWYESNAHESLHAGMTGSLSGGAQQCEMFSWHSPKDSQIL